MIASDGGWVKPRLAPFAAAPEAAWAMSGAQPQSDPCGDPVQRSNPLASQGLTRAQVYGRGFEAGDEVAADAQDDAGGGGEGEPPYGVGAQVAAGSGRPSVQ